MDKINKWNEWGEHISKVVEENNASNKSLKNSQYITTTIIGILVLLLGYIWQSDKAYEKEKYELLIKNQERIILNDERQNERITTLEEWKRNYEKAKGEHNTRGGSSSQSPNQLINNIQYVPEETQIVNTRIK